MKVSSRMALSVTAAAVLVGGFATPAQAATNCRLAGSSLTAASYEDGRQIGGSLRYECDSASVGDQIMVNAAIQTESGESLTLLASNDPTGQSKGNTAECTSASFQAPWSCTVYVAARPLPGGPQGYRLAGQGILTTFDGAPGGFPSYSGPLYALE